MAREQITESSVSDTKHIYLDSDKGVESYLESIGKPAAIAVDTEGASFHRFVDRIYLLQISTDTTNAIIDPLSVGTPNRLGELLQDVGVEVVLHDADYDLRLLRQDYGWQVSSLFDTRVAAQLLGIRSFGLAALLQQFFDIRLDKKHQRADWSMRPLTEDMLLYASHDTRWLLELKERLKADLEAKGRMHWAEEEFRRTEGAHWHTDESGEAFLKVKGARDLNRRELARLRELVAWRDGIAREIDRATFRVTGNETLLEIARISPSNAGELSRVKGFPRSINDSRTADLLAALKRANALSDNELPRFPKAPRWEKDPSFEDRAAALRRVRDNVAIQLELDPGVLCSRERLDTIARKKPESMEALLEVPGIRNWQLEVMGESLLTELGRFGSS